MFHHPDSNRDQGFEISPRFRRTLEERLARLEIDAEWDEAQIERLHHLDHIRRGSLDRAFSHLKIEPLCGRPSPQAKS